MRHDRISRNTNVDIGTLLRRRGPGPTDSETWSKSPLSSTDDVNPPILRLPLQSPFRSFGVSQHCLSLGQQTLSRLRHAHLRSIPPQQRCAALFFQRPRMTAQGRLRDPQAPRASGNAAALHDANKGAEQREIFKGGHSNYE
jgi:hypothetical protein